MSNNPVHAGQLSDTYGMSCYVKNPGGTFDVDIDGVQRLTERYTVRNPAASPHANTNRFCASLVNTDHQGYGKTLGFVKATSSYGEGDLDEVTVEWSGAAYDENGGNGNGTGDTGIVSETYSLRRATQMAPVETHAKIAPYFKDEYFRRFAERLPFSGNDNDRAELAVLRAAAISLAALDNVSDCLDNIELIREVGMTDYFQPTVEFSRTRTYNKYNFRTKLPGSVGFITPAAQMPKRAPELSGPDAKRTWLYIGATEDLEGNALKVTDTWVLSGTKGHCKFFYELNNSATKIDPETL